MGEVLKKLATVNIKGQNYDIELNKSAFASGKREIHIQNDAFRLAVPEGEFLKMSACVLYAKKQLAIIKGYKEDE